MYVNRVEQSTKCVVYSISQCTQMFACTQAWIQVCDPVKIKALFSFWGNKQTDVFWGFMKEVHDNKDSW